MPHERAVGRSSPISAGALARKVLVSRAKSTAEYSRQYILLLRCPRPRRGTLRPVLQQDADRFPQRRSFTASWRAFFLVCLIHHSVSARLMVRIADGYRACCFSLPRLHPVLPARREEECISASMSLEACLSEVDRQRRKAPHVRRAVSSGPSSTEAHIAGGCLILLDVRLEEARSPQDRGSSFR